MFFPPPFSTHSLVFAWLQMKEACFFLAMPISWRVRAHLMDNRKTISDMQIEFHMLNHSSPALSQCCYKGKKPLNAPAHPKKENTYASSIALCFTDVHVKSQTFVCSHPWETDSEDTCTCGHSGAHWSWGSCWWGLCGSKRGWQP